jgi:hypothetical protein
VLFFLRRWWRYRYRYRYRRWSLFSRWRFRYSRLSFVPFEAHDDDDDG